jgi:competence protein ComEC
MKTKNKIFFSVLFAIIFLSGCTLFFKSYNIDSNLLTIHFIDVGQGDSILIQYKYKNILIDAGPKESSSALLNYLKKYRIKDFKYVLATHPHEDHIGAMDKIIDQYPIAAFYAPKLTTNTKTFNSMISSLHNKSIKIHTAASGVTLNFDEALQCTFIAPNNTDYKDLNNYSAVLKIVFKNTSFLFMGDAQNQSEEEILNQNYNLQSNVIKIGHHGSRTSSSESFIKTVNPSIAVISCGASNDFGHPHKPTLSLLKTLNIKLYRTDKNGSIILTSDGKKIKSLTN